MTEDDGLVTLNGEAAEDSADGAIMVDDKVDGDTTLTLTVAAAQLATGAA